MDAPLESFMKATGFGSSPSPFKRPAPAPPQGQPMKGTRPASDASPQGFLSQLQQAPQAASVVPNTVSLAPGADAVGGQQRSGPKQAVHLQKFANPSSQPAVQHHSKAKDKVNNKPAASMPTSVAAGAKKVAEKAKGLNKMKREHVKAKPEWAYYKDSSEGVKNQRYLIAAVVSGLIGAAAGLKWSREREKGIWAIATIALITVSGATLYLYYSDTKPQTPSPTEGGGEEKVPLGVKMVQGRGQEGMQQPEQSNETMEQVLQKTGVDPSSQEGPRADYAYQRGKPTADATSSVRLSTKQLMRDAADYNMNEATFNEYMARLEGEAPVPFHQVQPFMPNSAQFEHRETIADAEDIYGISTSPGQSNRKFAYRESKMKQGGAKSMHYKDPPPGAVEPLDKVHPWMDIDESGKERMRVDPTSYINSERSLGIEAAPDAETLAKIREREDTAIRQAMAKANAVNSTFLEPITVVKPKESLKPPSAKEDPARSNRNTNSPSSLSTALPAEEVALQDPTMEKFKSTGLHGGNGDIDVPAVEGNDGLLAAFAPKKTPTEEDVDKARLDSRSSTEVSDFKN